MHMPASVAAQNQGLTVPLTAERCRQLQEVRSTFVKIAAETMESQQQVFDSLRREQSCLMQHVTKGKEDASSTVNLHGGEFQQGLAEGQPRPSTIVPVAAARSSDSVSEASWVCLSCSGISVETSNSNCFMHDAAFKSETGASLPGSALQKGSRVLAADASVLEVAKDPEDHEARATVVLKAGAAELEVTLDHRVLLSDNRMASQLKLSMSQFPACFLYRLRIRGPAISFSKFTDCCQGESPRPPHWGRSPCRRSWSCKA